MTFGLRLGRRIDEMTSVSSRNIRTQYCAFSSECVQTSSASSSGPPLGKLIRRSRRLRGFPATTRAYSAASTTTTAGFPALRHLLRYPCHRGIHHGGKFVLGVLQGPRVHHSSSQMASQIYIRLTPAINFAISCGCIAAMPRSIVFTALTRAVQVHSLVVSFTPIRGFMPWALPLLPLPMPPSMPKSVSRVFRLLWISGRNGAAPAA